MFETLGFGLLVLIVAMSLSMALIPIMMRLAPRLGMIDKPDPRKVHAIPIPRVGGVGIVIGALLPMVIWLSPNDTITAYLLGSLVLLFFGVWDDVKELGHYVKFIGQFVAVSLVVFYGDLYVSHIPFVEQELSKTAGSLFTVFAIVGMINAINHSDGLDGLAGGESLLSLAGIFYLAYQIEDVVVMMICLATIGGVFGFLRFNSHPARVFMGDGGSQFLGFTLGFLAVYLTQVSNTALSAALPLLLLGLPIVDIISVFAQRIYGGMNWFRATRNHIHHRLLDLGFYHSRSVLIIYSIQALLVVCGVLMPYESDALLIGIYLVMTVAVFGSLVMAERAGWRLDSADKGALEEKVSFLGSPEWLRTSSHKGAEILLTVFLLIGAFAATTIPVDVSLASAVLALILLARLVYGYRLWFLFLRLILYVAVAFVAYLLQFYAPDITATYKPLMIVFFGILALCVVAAVRFSKSEFFQANPLDYLALIMVVILALLSSRGVVESAVISLVVKMVVLFYAAELVMKHMSSRWNMLTVSALMSFVIIGIRGLV